MGTEAHIVEYIAEQSGLGPALSWRKMFGEYALYLEGRVVALVCDNQLFLKPTEAARPLLATLDAQPAYPGGKPWWRLGDEIEERELLQRLLRTTAAALPLPKPKAARKTAAKPKLSGSKPSKAPRRSGPAEGR